MIGIEGLLLIGLGVGIAIGLLAPNQRVGCVGLLVVPLAMIAYIGWWQGEHPENLRSTSGLDFIFGPLWPSLGALVGLFLGIFIRDRMKKK